MYGETFSLWKVYSNKRGASVFSWGDLVFMKIFIYSHKKQGYALKLLNLCNIA